jgi:molecular chaperone GrpE
MAEEKVNSEREPETIEEEDLHTLQQALAEEREKGENYLAKWQRAQADYINYKRHAEQEREEFGKFANSGVMLGILPVLDDLERAFESIPPALMEESWIDGIRLIDRKLRSILEAQGVESVEAIGQPFDPHLHEAVRQEKGEEGVVIEEVQKGYKFRDRVIRPSKVVVGNGETDDAE